MQRLRLSDVPAAVRASAAWAAGHGPLHDVLFGVLFSLLFTALRLVLHRALAPRAKRALARRGAGAEQALVALSEDMWEGVGAVLFMTAAVYVLLRHNYGCLPWDTASCIHGWPQHESNPYLDWLYLIKLGWYIANNLKHHVGVGTHITTDMVVHHIATVSLVTLSYIANFKRIGMLAMVVFNAANPLLHASRVSLYLRLQRAKFCCFVLFTLAFITTRVVALPAVVLRCTLLDTLTVGVSRPAYLTLNGALITLYALQLVWLYKILEILAAGEVKRGLSAATDAALPAEVDDATRMATKASGSITEAAADNAAASAAATNRAKAD